MGVAVVPSAARWRNMKATHRLAWAKAWRDGNQQRVLGKASAGGISRHHGCAP